MAFDGMTIVYILIATILLWLMLYLATRIIVSKTFASDKKIMLLLSSLIMVIIISLITGVIVQILGYAGDGMAQLRNLLDPNNGGRNYVTNMAPIINFLLFILILHFFVKMNWNNTIWVALIGIFLLYLLYSAIPELDFMNVVTYT